MTIQAPSFELLLVGDLLPANAAFVTLSHDADSVTVMSGDRKIRASPLYAGRVTDGNGARSYAIVHPSDGRWPTGTLRVVARNRQGVVAECTVTVGPPIHGSQPTCTYVSGPTEVGTRAGFLYGGLADSHAPVVAIIVDVKSGDRSRTRVFIGDAVRGCGGVALGAFDEVTRVRITNVLGNYIELFPPFPHGVAPAGPFECVSDDLNHLLCNAAYENDFEAVRAALADGADVRARASRGGFAAWTPLAWAATPAMAELLLAAGAEIDAEDADGYTPMFRALLYKRLDVADFLLQRGADPNYCASPEHTLPVDQALQVSPEVGLRVLRAGGRVGPKTYASLWLKQDSRALLDKWPILGAPIADRDKELMLAARSGPLDAVTTLLRDGASVAARDTAGASALDHALLKGNIEAARLLQRAELATLDNAKLFLMTLDDYDTSLRERASSFDLEARTPRGMTALMLAARYRRHRALGALLDLGANIEQRNGTSTPLVAAIESNNLYGMLMLLDRGAVMNLQIDGANPVLTAAIKADSDLLKHLLARGLEVPPGQYTKYDETGRLLTNVLAGIRPYVGPPTFSSWSDCKICRELPERMYWCRSAMGEVTGDGIPPITEQQFETFDRYLWKCPYCATYYDFEHDHDNGLTDGWDRDDLTRISLDIARQRLDAIPKRSSEFPAMAEGRIEREIARAAFASALATPGKKVQISLDEVKDGRRPLLIYELAPGAKRIAWHRVPDSQHDVLVAELKARGLEPAETDSDSMNDFIWIRTATGLEVYDAHHKVLDVAEDCATLRDGSVIVRGDVARVIAYASRNYVERGVKVVLRSGVEIDLVADYSISAEIYYQYNRNDLLFETLWCARIGHAVADWAGMKLENLI
ncbi:MAG TPA: ankyrin repeat domain-containing protein [Kofleriaceae bacterium]|nr:ankyrin repeat domain-containing protein [Kofleriaceae bacterium]